jgi:hypothetical protein
VICGNLVFTSGHGPLQNDGSLIRGVVGKEASKEDGYAPLSKLAWLSLQRCKRSWIAESRQATGQAAGHGPVHTGVQSASGRHQWLQRALRRRLWNRQWRWGTHRCVGLTSLPLGMMVEIRSDSLKSTKSRLDPIDSIKDSLTFAAKRSMTVSPRVELAIKHLETARASMKGLVADLSPEEWFWTPQPPISHIAWQVGHLAVAEYGLMLFRQRGRQEVDSELMSGAFRKLFMKGTSASADRCGPSFPEEILAVLDRVHQQVLLEVPEFPRRGSRPTD